MNRQANEPITLVRDCDAILVPAGTLITLPEGSVVFITQALGGNYTVNINGNLAQVAARDADALGFKTEQSEEGGKHSGSADGTVNEELIWEQLRGCYDPEIPINIVELGLVYECNISKLEDGGNRVDIVMTLTAPGCGMGEFLAADVQGRVMTVANVDEVYVELCFDPPWSPELMSEAARLQTGML